jgi:hypothetical protein
MYLKKTSSFNDKSPRSRKKKDHKHPAAEHRRASSLTNPRFCDGPYGLEVWTDSGSFKPIIDVHSTYFLINVQKALGDLGRVDTIEYKAIMAEIHRRADSGSMYPNKGDIAA